MDKRIEKTMKNLERNGIKPFYVENKDEVVDLVKTLIKKGETVSNGGSLSLKQTGIIDLLNSGDYNFVDRTGLEGEDLRQAYIKAFGSDTFFCSSNAITENGELYNVDGNSNRVACIVYGPRQVIMVVGVNKIVKDIHQAELRVKKIAAPANSKRFNLNTPCNKTGECISLSREDSYICDGCDSSARVCCSFVISAHQRHTNRIKVILVNEELGY